MVTLKIKGNGMKKMKRYIRNWDKMWKRLHPKILELGEEVHRGLINYIQSQKKRPGGDNNLENAIELLPLHGMARIGFGIGKIDKLNNDAPYWQFVNSGKTKSGATIPGGGKLVPEGIFQPGLPQPTQADFRGGRWITGGWSSSGKSYSFIPKKPMPAMNYIEAGGHLLDRKVKNFLKYVTKQIRKGRDL